MEQQEGYTEGYRDGYRAGQLAMRERAATTVVTHGAIMHSVRDELVAKLRALEPEEPK